LITGRWLARPAPGTVDGMSQSAAAHLVLGRKGEDFAENYLVEEKGLVVLSRNWRCREGELDFVCTDGTQLIVCEVKTRSGTRFGPPTESITDLKANRIRRLARRWQYAHRANGCPVRFDTIAILWRPGRTPLLDHQESVF
jgi:putative endonuclease